ncbi:ubiquitin-conjugating enzyme/RWD-like protein [Sporodiniella umbellata]|nr:ubiquitin-conjugating enzyme/RWD-like protein [Sporodiniella umbellata]
MNAGIAWKRIEEERRQWRKEHPHGFWARPEKKQDNSLDLFNWVCGIPGKKNTLWENSVYELIVQFPKEYPSRPPVCRFITPLFHPSVYPSGAIELPLLKEEEDWKPIITLTQLLLAIQDLLDNPDIQKPIQRKTL